MIHPIVEQLTELRRSWKMSPLELSSRIGYSESSVIKIERGERRCHLNALTIWANEFGYDIILAQKWIL